MVEDEVPVLIVGGSLVGLTTAMLLGHHGVPTLAVERHAGTAIHPRAGHFQLRTMELLRQLGLEERVRAKSLEMYSATGGIIAVESLAGRELATYVKELNEGVEGFSPTVRVFINQDVLEPILRERAVELGATLLNRTEVITIDFRADCADLLRDRNQGVIYVHNPELRGFFRLDRSGGTGFLVINTVGEDVTQNSAVDVQSGLTEERALQYLRTAIGTDMPMEIVDVANWRAEATCAERLREGRVFLSGDAAHVVPPNGGVGGQKGGPEPRHPPWEAAAGGEGGGRPA